MKKIIEALKAAGHALETPGDFTPEELQQVKADVGQVLAELETETMTGLMVSVDDGTTWQSSSGIRVMFHDANEADEGMEDLLVNITHEGIILDLAEQESGAVSQTASLLVQDLVGMTR